MNQQCSYWSSEPKCPSSHTFAAGKSTEAKQRLLSPQPPPGNTGAAVDPGAPANCRSAPSEQAVLLPVIHPEILVTCRCQVSNLEFLHPQHALCHFLGTKEELSKYPVHGMYTYPTFTSYTAFFIISNNTKTFKPHRTSINSGTKGIHRCLVGRDILLLSNCFQGS